MSNYVEERCNHLILHARLSYNVKGVWEGEKHFLRTGFLICLLVWDNKGFRLGKCYHPFANISPLILEIKQLSFQIWKKIIFINSFTSNVFFFFFWLGWIVFYQITQLRTTFIAFSTGKCFFLTKHPCNHSDLKLYSTNLESERGKKLDAWLWPLNH